MRLVEAFFVEVDRLWARQEPHRSKIRLSLIGSGALMLLVPETEIDLPSWI